MVNKPLAFSEITLDLIKEFEDARKAILNQKRIYKDAIELLHLSAKIALLRKIHRNISK